MAMETPPEYPAQVRQRLRPHQEGNRLCARDRHHLVVLDSSARFPAASQHPFRLALTAGASLGLAGLTKSGIHFTALIPPAGIEPATTGLERTGECPFE